jgi:hypothetical protein
MFKLLKLILVGLISYAAYEFIRGLMEGGDGGSGRDQAGPSSSPQLGRALDTDAGRMNMTGPARGERVMTEGSTGESIPHVVGRGVVKR